MKRIVVIMLAMLCPASYLIAQSATTAEKGKKSGFFNKLSYADIAVTNTHTAMPFGVFYQLFTGELHPGVEIGTEITWNHTKRYDWIQTIKVGYSFQEYIQHMVSIYTEGGMRYRLPWKMDLSGKLGIGYIFAIEDSKVFVLNNDGKYVERPEAGRSNLMASLGFDLRKRIDRYGTAVYIGYQQKVQFGFINSYVPMLPLNMGSIGVSIPLHKN